MRAKGVALNCFGNLRDMGSKMGRAEGIGKPRGRSLILREFSAKSEVRSNSHEREEGDAGRPGGLPQLVIESGQREGVAEGEFEVGGVVGGEVVSSRE